MRWEIMEGWMIGEFRFSVSEIPKISLSRFSPMQKQKPATYLRKLLIL